MLRRRRRQHQLHARRRRKVWGRYNRRVQRYAGQKRCVFVQAVDSADHFRLARPDCHLAARRRRDLRQRGSPRAPAEYGYTFKRPAQKPESFIERSVGARYLQRMDDKAVTRDRILAAATARIKHYGYGKTTMAEIAADSGMSPGNIYRFFEAKIDIAEAMARKHNADELGALAAIGRRRDWAPDKRLREVLLKRMRDNFGMLAENSKFLEVAEVLSAERPLFINELRAQERVILSGVIAEGAETGLFAAEDPAFAAEMIQCATIKFSVPQLFSHLTLAKLEREFQGVMDLLLEGLYAPQAKIERTRARETAEY